MYFYCILYSVTINKSPHNAISKLQSFTMSENHGFPTVDDVELSGSEDEKEAWPQFTLRFGKYKMSSLFTMVSTKKRRDYLRYLSKWDAIEPDTKTQIDAALKWYASHKIGCGVVPMTPKMEPIGNPVSHTFSEKEMTLMTPVKKRRKVRKRSRKVRDADFADDEAN